MDFTLERCRRIHRTPYQFVPSRCASDKKSDKFSKDCGTTRALEFSGHGHYTLDLTYEEIESDEPPLGERGTFSPTVQPVLRNVRLRDTFLCTRSSGVTELLPSLSQGGRSLSG